MASLGDVYQAQLYPRVQVWVLSLTSLLFLCLLYFQYAHGLYDLSLVSGYLLGVLVLYLLLVYINQDRETPEIFNYFFVLFFSVGVLYQVVLYADMTAHLLVLIPIFLYFSLPIIKALVANISVLVLLLLYIFIADLPNIELYLALFYFAFSFVVFCFCYFCVMHDRHLKTLALTDSISGAYNQEHLQFLLKREVARSNLTDQSISLIGLVLSDYNQMMELHGKRSLLELLPKLVNYINAFIRGEDDIFRVEDDLFFLVLPNCAEEGAIVLQERLKQKLQEKSWEPFSEVAIQVEAVTHQEGESASGCIQRLLEKLNKTNKKQLRITSFSH